MHAWLVAVLSRMPVRQIWGWLFASNFLRHNYYWATFLILIKIKQLHHSSLEMLSCLFSPEPGDIVLCRTDESHTWTGYGSPEQATGQSRKYKQIGFRLKPFFAEPMCRLISWCLAQSYRLLCTNEFAVFQMQGFLPVGFLFIVVTCSYRWCCLIANRR